MINKLTNDRGYALVTVLLIITIFMLLAASFMTQSSNTRGQIASAESKVQSVDLAEMGIEYYKMEINEEILRITNLVNEDLAANVVDLSLDNLKAHVVDKFNEELEKSFFDDPTENLWVKRGEKTVEGSNAYRVDMNESDFISGTDSSEIRFNSTGIVDGTEGSSISSSLEISFGNLEVETSDPTKSFDLIADPDPENNFSVCSGTDLTNKKCRTLGEQSYGNKKPTLSNSILKVNGKLTMGNYNKQDIEDSTLYITGDFKVGRMNKLSSGKIFVGGDAEFSVLAATANNGSNVTIVVKGSASFHNLHGLTNSKICVNELTSIGPSGKVGENTNIYAKKYKNIANGKYKFDEGYIIVGEEAFLTGACLGTGESQVINPTISWLGNPIEKEEYNY